MMVLPTNMELADWANVNVPFLEQFDSIGKLVDGDWQRWGAALCLALPLSGLNIPSPYEFADWRLWAQRVCEELA